MVKNEAEMAFLRENRVQAQVVRDHARLRALCGEKIVTVVSEATGRPLLLDDFDNKGESLSIEWSANIKDATGLVAAYISRSEANKMLVCARGKLGALSGKIGFHEKPCLGFAAVYGVDPTSLIAIAESTEDSVIFCNDVPVGTVMVDCYTSQPCEPFSIVVQGDDLVQMLAPCFHAGGSAPDCVRDQ